MGKKLINGENLIDESVPKNADTLSTALPRCHIYNYYNL